MADDFTPPQDYSAPFANVPSPVSSFQQGLQTGFATQQGQLQQQMQRYQFARMQQLQHAAMTVAQDPTPENISQLSIAFPEMSEQFKRSYDMLQPAQQREQLNFGTQIYAAMQNNRPDLAANLLTSRADAMENSGANPQRIAELRQRAQWATTDPSSFKASTGVMLAGLMGPDKFADAFKGVADAQKTLDTTPAAVAEAGAKASEAITTAQNAPAKQGADIAKTNADVTNMAGRLAIDRDTLMSNTQTKNRELTLQYGTPSPETATQINEAASKAAAGEMTASRYNDLANRIETADRATGGNGVAAEAWKKAFGVQDGVSALKQEYARIVNTGALSNIKDALGGRVTDVDMKTAMGTVPDANASTTSVTSYLRGVAKIQQLDAARQQAQAEWLAQTGRNGHLGPARQDLTVMGTKVPAGTTFADFSRQFLQQKAEQIGAQSALARAQGRSYLRFTQPDAGGAPQPQAGGATGTY